MWSTYYISGTVLGAAEITVNTNNVPALRRIIETESDCKYIHGIMAGGGEQQEAKWQCPALSAVRENLVKETSPRRDRNREMGGK